MTRAQLDKMSDSDIRKQIEYCKTMRRFYTPDKRRHMWNEDIRLLKAELAART